MATTDDLIISIRADVNQLQNQLRNVDSQLRGTERQGNETAQAIKGLALQFLGLGAAISGIDKLVSVNREFGILKAGLETATGSIKGATEAFTVLQQFAASTPYSLQQAVDGFTKLVNLGLTPSERALKSYGDTSAALGKDLSQMIEAVADAATGEFERLKEFGIKSKNQGDTIAFTFRGTTETVKNNATAIEEYLIGLGEVNFDGAMKKRMGSLDGALSNLSDSFDAFFFNIGQAGATDALNSGFRQLGGVLSDVNEYIKDIPVADFKNGLELVGDAALLFAGYMATKVAVGLALSTQEFIKNIASQSALRLQTLAGAEADAASAGIAARRAIVEKQLALDQLNRARATTAAALSTQQGAIADLEAAKLQSILALGTQHATAANLARALAADKVTRSTLTLNAAMAAESAALGRATAAHAANTAAITTQASASTVLAQATTAATVAGRASATMLTALGGPIGAVITALGLAATAWFVFGENSETAVEKALNSSKKLKEGLNGTVDEMRIQTDALMDVNVQIKKIEDTLANWKGGIRLIDKEVSLAELKKQKEVIEENIENLKLTKILNEFLNDTKGDALEKFGVEKKPREDEASNQESKKADGLRKAAQELLKQTLESNMSESQLQFAHQQDLLKQLKDFYDKKALTASEYQAGVLAANASFESLILKQMMDDFAKENALMLEKQTAEDEYRTNRINSIQQVIEESRRAGLTELELLDEQHQQKMDKRRTARGRGYL